MAKARVITETYPRGNRSSAGAAVPGLSIPDHDLIEMTYTGGNLTGVKYFTQAGASVGKDLRAELELRYDGANNLVSVTKLEI